MNEGQGSKPGCKECWQDGGWDRVGGQEKGVQPGPQWRRLAQLPPPTHTREVSCCNQSRVCVGLELEPKPEQERLGGEGRGKRQSAGFYSWRRTSCLLLATLTCLLVPPCLSRHLGSLCGYAIWPVSFSLILLRSQSLSFSVYFK